MSNNLNKQPGVKELGPFKNIKLSGIMNRDSSLTRLFFIMVFVFLLMSVLKPDPFLTIGNFNSMFFQIPEFGIIAVGMMLTMLTGGIDLSIVGIANLAGILAAFTMVRLTPQNAPVGQQVLFILLAVVVAIIVGLICGIINGFLIAKVGIPPILATLGSSQLYMGIAIVLTQGKAVLGFPESFAVIGNGTILGFPVPMLIFIVIAALISIMLNKSRTGTRLYMMGTNPIASLFSGINNITVTLKTYLLSAVMGSMAGLILIARTNSAKADYGTSYTLQAVLVAVMGGVNPNGGFGKIVGLVMAMFTLQFLSSGFNAMHFSNFFKDFIWGVVLIVVMIVNYISEVIKARSVKKS